jgi:hypothetical protein
MVGEDKGQFFAAVIALGQVQAVFARRDTTRAGECEVDGFVGLDAGWKSFVASTILIAERQAINGRDEPEGSRCGYDGLHVEKILTEAPKDSSAGSLYLSSPDDGVRTTGKPVFFSADLKYA